MILKQRLCGAIVTEETLLYNSLSSFATYTLAVTLRLEWSLSCEFDIILIRPKQTVNWQYSYSFVQDFLLK